MGKGETEKERREEGRKRERLEDRCVGGGEGVHTAAKVGGGGGAAGGGGGGGGGILMASQLVIDSQTWWALIRIQCPTKQ